MRPQSRVNDYCDASRIVWGVVIGITVLGFLFLIGSALCQ